MGNQSRYVVNFTGTGERKKIKNQQLVRYKFTKITSEPTASTQEKKSMREPTSKVVLGFFFLLCSLGSNLVQSGFKKTRFRIRS